MRPFVSVVLPVHNVQAHISETLDSLARQTHADFEVIVINDGSEDGTLSEVHRCVRNDPRFVVVDWPDNRGIVAALNYGLSVARGEFIARMDGDDLCHPQRLALQSDFLIRNPGIGLVSSQVGFLSGALDGRGFARYVWWLNQNCDAASIFRYRFVDAPVAHPSVMFRRQLVMDLGGYLDGPFPEDYELWLRLLESGVRMVKLPQLLLHWRDRPERLTRTHARYHIDQVNQLKAKYLARWLQKRGVSRIWVWGAGKTSRKRANYLCDHGIEIGAFLDIDGKKIGQTVQGRPVYDGRRICDLKSEFVVSYVGSHGAREEIERLLLREGLLPEQDFLLAA